MKDQSTGGTQKATDSAAKQSQRDEDAGWDVADDSKKRGKAGGRNSAKAIHKCERELSTWLINVCCITTLYDWLHTVYYGCHFSADGTVAPCAADDLSCRKTAAATKGSGGSKLRDGSHRDPGEVDDFEVDVRLFPWCPFKVSRHIYMFKNTCALASASIFNTGGVLVPTAAQDLGRTVADKPYCCAAGGCGCD